MSLKQVIKDFYNETIFSRTGSVAAESMVELLWSFTVAIMAIGGMFGGVLGAFWANRFGR